jgi:hypothetical protein
MYWRVPTEGKEREFGMLLLDPELFTKFVGREMAVIGAHMEAISTERVLWFVMDRKARAQGVDCDNKTVEMPRVFAGMVIPVLTLLLQSPAMAFTKGSATENETQRVRVAASIVTPAGNGITAPEDGRLVEIRAFDPPLMVPSSDVSGIAW